MGSSNCSADLYVSTNWTATGQDTYVSHSKLGHKYVPFKGTLIAFSWKDLKTE
jgi:hypothetical protein